MCKASHRFTSRGGLAATDDRYGCSPFACSPASLRNHEGPPHPIALTPVSQNAVQGTVGGIRSCFQPAPYFLPILSLIFLTYYSLLQLLSTGIMFPQKTAFLAREQLLSQSYRLLLLVLDSNDGLFVFFFELLGRLCLVFKPLSVNFHLHLEVINFLLKLLSLPL